MSTLATSQRLRKRTIAPGGVPVGSTPRDSDARSVFEAICSFSGSQCGTPGCPCRKTQTDQRLIHCPCHPDGDPSLSVRLAGEKILLYDHGGCPTKQIIEFYRARGLWPTRQARRAEARQEVPRRIVATYPYVDERGHLLFEVVRFDPKDFRQRRPNGKGGWVWNLDGVCRVLYRLPELLAAAPEAPVFIVEGEQDTNRLVALGLVVTTNPGGAGKWSPAYNDALRGRHVVIVPDNDAAGRAHAQQVAQVLHGVAASVKVVELPGLAEKGDVSDWLDADGTRNVLEALATKAPEWAPEAAPDLAQLLAGCPTATEPKMEWVGIDACRIRWESRKLLLTLSRLRETSGGLVADIELWHDVVGLLDFGTLNLHSRNSREAMVRKLEAHIGKGDGFPNWFPLLERTLWMVATDFRRGDGDEPLQETVPKPHAYLLEPLLSSDHTNVLYGPWESGKSTVADMLALSVATGRALPGLSAPTVSGHVVYSDWEAERFDHSASVTAIAKGLGWPFPADRIHYLRLRGRPLTMALPAIADVVHRHKAVLWIGDSLEPASVIPGSESWHHASIAAFNAVATLPCTRLFIGQQSHEERAKAGSSGRLFGSVFGMYLTRNAWAVRRTDDDETSGRLTFALYHHKASFDRRRPPMAFQVAFERPGFTTVRRLELRDAPDLFARATLPHQIRKLLAGGAKSAPELAETVDKPAETIERTLRRPRKAGVVVDLEERRDKHQLWGLAARQ